MAKQTDHLKKIGQDALDRKPNFKENGPSPIAKGTKYFFIGALFGILICLILLPLIGFYPSLRDGVISAVIGGIINVLSNKIK